MILLLVLVTLFVLLAIGAPVGFAMGKSGALGLWLTGGPDMLMGILQTTPLTSVSSYELITIPMFLLMAVLVLVSGVADGLFRAAAARTVDRRVGKELVRRCSSRWSHDH